VWFTANRRRRPAAAAAVDETWSWADAEAIIADGNSIRAPATADALPGEAIISMQSSLWLTTGAARS
jgi:hypothetical protein